MISGWGNHGSIKTIKLKKPLKSAYPEFMAREMISVLYSQEFGLWARLIAIRDDCILFLLPDGKRLKITLRRSAGHSIANIEEFEPQRQTYYRIPTS